MPLMLVCFPGQLTNTCCDKHDDLIINLTDYLFARLLVRVNVAACVRMSADLASVFASLELFDSSIGLRCLFAVPCAQ